MNEVWETENFATGRKEKWYSEEYVKQLYMIIYILATNMKESEIEDNNGEETNKR